MNRLILVISVTLTALTSPAWGGEVFVASHAAQPMLRGSASDLAFSTAWPLNHVDAMCGTDDGVVWIATQAPQLAVPELVGLDVRDGTLIAAWGAPEGVVAMTFAAGRLWVALADQRLLRVDPLTGVTLSDWRAPGDVDAVVVAGGIVYVAGPDGKVWSTATDAPPSWKQEASIFGHPVHALAIRGSQLLVGSPGHVYIFERDSGFLLYGYNVPNNAISIVVDGNDALISGSDGTVVRADPTTGQVVEVVTIDVSGGPSAWPVSAMAIVDPAPLAVVMPHVAFASISKPNPVKLRMEVTGELTAMNYLLVGGLKQQPSSPLVIDGVTIPVSADAYFSVGLSGAGIIEGSFGSFSNQNALGLFLAEASFKLPPNLPASVAGLVLYHAFITIDPATFHVVGVSNVQSVTIGY